MPIKKVWIEDDCIACGMCESVCPEVFKIEDIAVVIEGVNYADHSDGIIEASDSCPVEVIKYSE